MKNLKFIYISIICILFFIGCAERGSLVNFVKEGGLETKGLVNLALAGKGTIVSVSQENSDHPGATLIDGIITSDQWDQGQGWESKYEGQFARGEYVGYGVEDPEVVMNRVRNRNRTEQPNPNESYDTGDSNWRGLRTQTMYGNVDTAMGWVIIQFPGEKTVNRAVIYTIDSEKYPSAKFGISDFVLQYWSNSANSWAVVEKMGKSKGQAGNEIQNNTSGVITMRFQPIKTSKLRLVIRWTNDSSSFRRGVYQYSMGSIRLIEIEVYGYEKEAVDQTKVAELNQDANTMAEIQTIVDNYVYGYNKKDISMLMSSISTEYSKDGEKYSDFRGKIESIFAKYDKIKIELKNTNIDLTESKAVVTANYSAQYGSESAGGVLMFSLSHTNGYWRIIRVDAK